MLLLIGLGNPGKEYEYTRHNIGFRIVDALAKELDGGEWTYSEKFHAFLLKPHEPNESITYNLVKPSTFMNLSGKSVAALVNFYKLDPKKDLLVISDDKDMVFGKIRERTTGASGGHKGLQSIIDHLGTNAFHRIKIGIGHERVARSALRSEVRLSSVKPNGTKDAAGRNIEDISSGGERFPIADQRIPTDAFVLQKFSAEEEKALPGIIEEAVKKVQTWMAS